MADESPLFIAVALSLLFIAVPFPSCTPMQQIEQVPFVGKERNAPVANQTQSNAAIINAYPIHITGEMSSAPISH